MQKYLSQLYYYGILHLMPSMSTTALLTCGSYDKKQQGGTVLIYTHYNITINVK